MVSYATTSPTQTEPRSDDKPPTAAPAAEPYFPAHTHENAKRSVRTQALTHVAEDGASTPVLMKLSGHTSVRSLAKYARVSDEGLRRYQADSDTARRRTGR